MADFVLPAMSTQQEAKTKGLLDKIAEFMGVEYKLETVVVMKVRYSDDRQDFGTILKKLVSKSVANGRSPAEGEIK